MPRFDSDLFALIAFTGGTTRRGISNRCLKRTTSPKGKLIAVPAHTFDGALRDVAIGLVVRIVGLQPGAPTRFDAVRDDSAIASLSAS